MTSDEIRPFLHLLAQPLDRCILLLVLTPLSTKLHALLTVLRTLFAKVVAQPAERLALALKGGSGGRRCRAEAPLCVHDHRLGRAARRQCMAAIPCCEWRAGG
jgi:hypothetical protein